MTLPKLQKTHIKQIAKWLKRKISDYITRIAEWVEKRITEYIHLILIAAPIVAVSLSWAFGSDTHTPELIFTGLALLIVFLLLIIRAKTEQDRNKDASLFHTLVFNDLLPPRGAGGELVFNIEVSVIQETEKGFKQALEDHFSLKPHTDKAQHEPNDDDERLRFKRVKGSSVERKTVDKSTEKETIKDQTNHLSKDLSKSDAVLVVRTEQLDESLTYECVNEWSFQHSEIPILAVRPKERQTFGANEMADKFLWIRDNAAVVPWGLLSRAVDRASLWRTQASFNRAMLFNIFVIFLLLTNLGIRWFQTKSTAFQAESAKHLAEFQAESAKHLADMNHKGREYKVS